jgi:acyl CoA:acetate/3-ketoacid CoA transferase beta subunit
VNAGVNYTESELLACVGSHILEDKKAVFVGTGLPMIAAMLAQKTHAPNLLIIFEAGGIGPVIPALPISVGDSRTFHKAISASSMHDAMSMGQAGLVEYGFLGAAQIDMYGNINSTVIGDHDAPTARLPGSGGANDIGSFCPRTIIIMRQSKRSFVNKLDFLTTPGYLTGPGARENAGLPPETGPYRVVTQLAMYEFDQNTKRMTLVSIHPGVSLQQLSDNSQFEIVIGESYTTATPTYEELALLHEQIDPDGIVLRKNEVKHQT